MLDKSKVLIVDDKQENLFALQNVLCEIDVELIKATNGNDALKETLNHQFALAILDIQMPGMNGYELAELLRGEDKIKQTPIIFLSAAFSDDFQVFKGYESGAVDFLTKPYDPRILQHKVKVFVELDKQKREFERNKIQLEELVEKLKITNEQLKHEITEREVAEERLQKSHAHIKLLQEVAVKANESESVDETLQYCIERVCDLTSWPVGHVYIAASDNPDKLEPTSIWCLKDTKRFKAFYEVTMKTEFTHGIGLPGRVFESGKTSWIVDVTKDPNFPRAKAAKNNGVRAAFCFPVFVKEKVSAVLEFFSTEATNPEEELITIMAQIGTQIGRVVERKYAESELKKSEQKIDAIIRSVGEGIVSIGENSIIRFVNQEFCGIFGYTTEELTGQDIKILMPEKYRQAHTDSLKQRMNGAPPKIIGKRIEIEGLHKNGKVFPIEIRIEETIDPSGEHIFTASLRNITEVKKAEKELNQYASEMEKLAENRAQQLIHADRMTTVGTLSAGVAHEINNPVGFISGNLDIFEKMWNRTVRACLEKAKNENEDKSISFVLDEMPKMVKTMKEGVTRISNIVRNLGKFSRKTETTLEPSDMREVIDAAVKLCRLDLSLKHRVNIKLDLSNDIPIIKISRQEIEQVLINLITNSGHALEEVTDRKELILKIAASHIENDIVIEITDNGCGMDEETLSSIFNPFFTTKDVGKGTGLGLAICSGIIEHHRGAITATSTLGKGTTFTIKLPIDPERKERRKKNDKKSISVRSE